MTAIAWNISLFAKLKRCSGEPRISTGVLGPSTITLTIITKIAIKARPLVFASLDISRYSDSGYDTNTVKNVIQSRRLAKIHNTGIRSISSTSDRMTCGIVSPRIIFI